VSNPSQITTVLATGCSGFLGRHCAHALVRHGFPVHAISRTRSGVAADGITWHSLDLHDRSATGRLIATLRPSHLLHLAWVTAPDRYRYAPENLDWLEASLALVKNFGKQGGQRFVGAGSSRHGSRYCGADHFHARGLVHFGARVGREDEPALLVADMAKVERVLGWRPPTSIDSGLERLLSGPSPAPRTC